MAPELTSRLLAAATRLVDDALSGVGSPWSSPPAAPGAAIGVVDRHGLVTWAGRGVATVDGGSVPDARTVFRIASMTKSFTAAAVLHLRDRGVVTLDDPITAWVPEATGFAAGDRPAPTLDELLRMTSGLAEDDPLGDRYQDMRPDAFDLYMREPVVAVHPWRAGAFEYSNYGYALLGRAVTNASGQSFMDLITERFLEPLGMGDTTWSAPSQMAGGYVRRGGLWCAEPVDGPGAFGAMGGLFSSVADIARWVAFLMGGQHTDVMSASSRAEMQLGRTPRPMTRPSGHATNFAPFPAAYAYGLSAATWPGVGQVSWHSGGYPGFGSSMVWLPQRGVGLVVLMNGRYAPATRVAFDALAEAMTDRPAATWHAPRTAAAEPTAGVDPHPSFRWIAERVTALLDQLPGDVPGAMNVELDEPWELRRRRLTHARSVLGDSPVIVGMHLATPLRGRWRVRGAHGEAELSMMLTPTAPLQLMTLSVEVIPPVSAALDVAGRAAAAVWNAVAGGVARLTSPWEPLGVAAVAGPILGDRVLAGGDGSTWAQWRIPTPTGAWLVSVAVDGVVTAVSVAPG